MCNGFVIIIVNQGGRKIVSTRGAIVILKFLMCI